MLFFTFLQQDGKLDFAAQNKSVVSPAKKRSTSPVKKVSTKSPVKRKDVASSAKSPTKRATKKNSVEVISPAKSNGVQKLKFKDNGTQTRFVKQNTAGI